MKNLIFDISILGNEYYQNSKRSGIFHASKQLFCKLYAKKKFNLLLYCDIHNYHEVKSIVKKYFPDLTLITNGRKIDKVLQRIECFINFKYDSCTNKFFHKLMTVSLIVLNHLINTKYITKRNKKLIENYSCFFSPIYAIPECIEHLSLKKVLIIYDLIPLRIPSYKSGLDGWFGEVIKKLNKNDFYLTISEFTKADFIETYKDKIDETKVFNTYLGVSDRFSHLKKENDSDLLRKKYNIVDGQYIFSLCNIEDRKNLYMQVDSFLEFINRNSIKDFYYVMGGGASSFNLLIEKFGNKYSEEVKKYIKYIGYVDDDDLPILYRNAKWFTFTSKFEGFGLPPLEAMKCGCPVIVSNSTSLPEVCCDAAIYVDCNSMEEHITAYENYYNSESLRNEFGKKGIKQSEKFDWNIILDNYIGILNNNIL